MIYLELVVPIEDRSFVAALFEDHLVAKMVLEKLGARHLN